MCGITGYFSFKDKIRTDFYYRAHLKIAHRGPDDEGFLYLSPEGKIELLAGDDTISELRREDNLIYKRPPSHLILGHRRLSIIDLSASGHQPYNFRNLYLVYNGEIYNYLELRKELENLGYYFTTNSDTEVFLKAFYHWGEKAFNRFNGMWAAAIYDSETEELLLTRDRFGIKPLYYSIQNGTLIFGSEIKFILPFLREKKLNNQAIFDYLEYNYLFHNEKTFFQDIFQLLPGHYLVFSREKFLLQRYYFPFSVFSYEGTLAQIRELLLDSIRLRLRSDVKVGSLLSGGVDSSSIVCGIHYQNLVERMDTFTITYQEKELDFESPYVKDVISKTGFNNYQVFLSPQIELIDKLTYIVEFPYRSFTESAMYRIYEYIKTNTSIKVLLNGEGSDELFSGYTSHYFSFLLELLLKGKKDFLSEYRLIKEKLSLSHFSLGKKLVSAFLKHKRKRFNYPEYYRKKVERERPVFSLFPFRDEILFNRYYSALPEYLAYADRISMYFSLEPRVPFLDYRLVSLADFFPAVKLIQKGVTKFPLREAMRGIIPDSIYFRKDKKGFFTPHQKWITEVLNLKIKEEIKRFSQKEEINFIDGKKVLEYLEKVGIDQRIWRIYCFLRWKKVWKLT